ncbi:MAG: recombinase family protein, partial [bacterium]
MQEKRKSNEIVNCAIYTRVSTDTQADKEFNSCEAQYEKIKSFINSQEGFKIFKIYNDPGYTGANLDRPAFKQMLSDIES